MTNTLEGQVADAWTNYIRNSKDPKGAKETLEYMSAQLADAALDLGQDDPRFPGVMFARNLLVKAGR